MLNLRAFIKVWLWEPQSRQEALKGLWIYFEGVRNNQSLSKSAVWSISKTEHSALQESKCLCQEVKSYDLPFIGPANMHHSFCTSSQRSSLKRQIISLVQTYIPWHFFRNQMKNSISLFWPFKDKIQQTMFCYNKDKP